MERQTQKHGITGSWAWTGFLCLLLVLISPPICAVTNHLEKSIEMFGHGDLEGAEKEARMALNDSSSPALAWATLGNIRFRQAKYEESEEFLGRAIHMDPELVSARISLGIVYIQRGKLVQARNSFQRALKIDPKNFDARFDLAKLDAQSAFYSSSLGVAKPVISALRNFDEGVLVLATDYLGLHQFEPARALISDWKALRETDQHVAVDFASLLIQKHLIDEAIEVLEKTKLSGQVTYDLAYMLANSYLSKDNLKQASANYELAVGLKYDCISCLM